MILLLYMSSVPECARCHTGVFSKCPVEMRRGGIAQIVADLQDGLRSIFLTPGTGKTNRMEEMITTGERAVLRHRQTSVSTPV